LRFVLYTDKTVAQCLAAVNERLQQPPTKSRPELDGWVEKKGRFAISIHSPVVAAFKRRTTLEAVLEREAGFTVIRGSVPDGAPPAGQIIVLVALLLLAAFFALQGQAVLAIFVGLAGPAAYIFLRGDYENGDRLLLEVERALKATPKPPKKYVQKMERVRR
jgi:hypothetical protein